MQVTGKFSAVVDKVKLAGPFALYNGALAAASATFVGHYPWFFTYNYLSEAIPEQDTALAKLGRRAILGFCSSAVSDTCSNSIRVLKVYKQSHPEQLTYIQCLQNVVKESGVSGLMFRGYVPLVRLCFHLPSFPGSKSGTLCPASVSHPFLLVLTLVFYSLTFRLETKILANGLQGILFSILWKHFEEVLFPKNK